jgi:hypothetical protein
MTAEGLRAAQLREKFGGHDPEAVEAALDRWADAIERGQRLDPADLSDQQLNSRFRG